MSPVADCDLKHFLERTPFSVHDLELLRGFYGCLCSGLAYLHEQKCRHKDIKPENILVKGQTIFITDFGTARDMTGQSRSETTGTPGPRTARYAAPEVMDWNPRGYSSDIWSLGCVFLDMTVVLKGKTIESMRAFLNENGNGLAFPHQNLAGLALLFDVLTTGTTDNQPIVWVKAMMRKLGKDRVSASPLLQSILEYNDDHRYYGLCCDTNDSSDIDSSYAGSVMEGVTLKPTSTDDSDTYHTRLVQNTKASETQHLIGADVGGAMDNLEAYISPGTPGLVELPLPNEKSVPDPASTRQPLRTVEFLKPDDVSRNTLAVWNFQTSSVADSISNKTDRIERESYSSALGPNEARDKLVSAVKQGSVRAVQRMLSEGYDIRARTDDGLTLLMHAVCAEQYQVVIVLLTKGADVIAQDSQQQTALHYAVHAGSEATVRLLLEKGADIEARDNTQMTPFHYAVHAGSEATVRLLLEKGADIEARDNTQMTPFHYAAQRGSEVTVRLLLEKGADIEARTSDQMTPLHWAAQGGSEATVRLLLEKGADIEARDNNQWTPLHHAVQAGSEATVRLLLEKGANIKAQAFNQMTPLHCAAYGGSEATVRLLLEEGADINVRTADLTTPLHCAAEVQSERTIWLLLEKGADQSAENWKGQKPKDMIKRRGNAPWLAELFKDPSS
ncbi:MAG: hypothetical protein M1825_005652 [Sarcosagium campestre]|nr:MAG: hypothetical protein M1825_005652 [Sarcosagium campestre]